MIQNYLVSYNIVTPGAGCGIAATSLREIGVPLHTADFKVSLYKKWVKELGYSVNELKLFNTRRLSRAISYTNSKKDAEKILKKARELNFDDFLGWLKDTYS